MNEETLMQCNCGSVNIGHLEAVVHILEQPFITGVSRVCKPFPLSPTIGNGEKSDCGAAKGVYVDIVCTLNRDPVWFIVSDRNPKYVSWDECSGNKGLRTRIQQVLDAARSSLTLKPSSVILFFSNGLDQCVCEKLQGEFGAYECAVEFPDCSFDFLEEPESEWINVFARSYRGACILEIKVDHVSPSVLVYDVKDSPPDAVGTQIPEKHIDISLGASFSSLISGMKFCCLHAEGVETLLGQDDLINFDTTALIAVVSGISNGGTEKLLAAPETEMRLRFKGNYKFVIAQVRNNFFYVMITKHKHFLNFAQVSHLEYLLWVLQLFGANDDLSHSCSFVCCWVGSCMRQNFC